MKVKQWLKNKKHIDRNEKIMYICRDSKMI